MKSLLDIYIPLAYYTDKGTIHTYIETYEALFASYRDKSATLLEIGVQRGASLDMWESYFTHPDAKIIGVDIKDQREEQFQINGRVLFIESDINKIANDLPPLDIVIDDGSHTLVDQYNTFNKLWPKVNKGGCYVIEDVQSDSDIMALKHLHPFQIVDLRRAKIRYDDVLLIARK